LKRFVRLLGLTMGLIALLSISITGAVFAAGDNAEFTKNHYMDCPYDEPYGDDIPNLWGEPGPHGQNQ